MAFHYKKLLSLRVVIMISSGNPRLSSRNEYLSNALLFNEFRQTTAGIGLDIQVVSIVHPEEHTIDRLHKAPC